MPKTPWSLQLSSKPSSSSTSLRSWKSGADRNMICFPTFLCIGAWDLLRVFCWRSSCLNFVSSILCCITFFRRSISFFFSRPSTCFAPTSVSSTSSRNLRSSSSLASMLFSMSCVSGSCCSLSLPQALCTSTTFSHISLSRTSCSDEWCFSETSCLSCSHLRFSADICCSRWPMFCFILFVVASLLRFISSYFCCSSSRACSVSWEFWIRNRLFSSSEVKTSSSSFGFWK
mmetsp:Transcript_25325/g.57597  ORF Transcript_25325/g.57597 Transcript_25325/m.57597 type:complete len:230 (+) Transcript_25325:158-847(+)